MFMKTSNAESREALRAPHVNAILADYEGVVGPPLIRLPFKERIYSKIDKFVSDLSGVPYSESEAKRLELLRKYGTNTTGYALKMEYGISCKDFVRAAYFPEIEKTSKYINEDKKLLRAMESISMPKAVLSNSTIEYISRALSSQGVKGMFMHIICLERLDTDVKPKREAWLKAIDITGFTAHGTLYVDDNLSHLETPHSMGFTTVLIDAKRSHSKESAGNADYIFSDFTSLLEALSRK